MTDLRDPLTLAPLTRRAVGVCAVWEGGSRAWPEVDGIPYLRVGRDELADRVVARVEAGDEAAARAELLRDQDDFARQPPPTLEEAKAISRDEPATFREAMRRLEYGSVAHYFAHRTSTPTFLSGLALLAFAGLGVRVLEVCCGAGHFLRYLSQRSVHGTAWMDDLRPGDPMRHVDLSIRGCGADVVWSKLWLARRYLDVPSDLVACDAVAAPLPLADNAFDIGFCHDAIYFLPEKETFLGELRRLSGGLLIGHAHNRLADHGDVAGTPLSPTEYAAIAAPEARFSDDAHAARVVAGLARHPGPFVAEDNLGSQPREQADQFDRSEAIAWVEFNRDDRSGRGEPLGDVGFSAMHPYRTLRLNPLLVERDGQLVPDWPEERFAVEYADADYLTGPIPTDQQIARAEAGDWADDPAMRDFVARRTFIDLPERW